MNPVPVTIKDNLIGRRFHKLVVEEFAYITKNGHSFWKCRCDCGGVRITRGHSLKKKFEPTKSCGCLINGQLRHGASKTKAHKVWVHMLERCYNPKDRAYYNYGGRGISVCKGWQVSDNFLRQMGQPPENHQLDRKDNSGGYWCGECPECVANNWPLNCRWVTRIIQSRNRRNNVFIEYNGIRATIAEWSEITGIKAATISARLQKGYPPERCLRPIH